ncbi:SDR family NAD(P)-dependent oxidoreductase [Polaromonas sp. P5_D5]
MNKPLCQIVIGGSDGIGRSLSQKFCGEGKNVIFTGLSGDLPDYSSMACPEVFGTKIKLDVREPSEIDQFGEFLCDNVLIENLIFAVGGGRFSELSTAAPTYVQDILAINLSGPLSLLSKIHLAIARNGTIVFLGSSVSTMGIPGASAYAAAKCGLIGAARSLCNEFADRQIRCNVVSPGLVETALYAKLGLNYSDIARSLAPKIAARRGASASEIAAVISFLCSSEGSYINGTEIVVDGGMRVMQS